MKQEVWIKLQVYFSTFACINKLLQAKVRKCSYPHIKLTGCLSVCLSVADIVLTSDPIWHSFSVKLLIGRGRVPSPYQKKLLIKIPPPPKKVKN